MPPGQEERTEREQRAGSRTLSKKLETGDHGKSSEHGGAERGPAGGIERALQRSEIDIYTEAHTRPPDDVLIAFVWPERLGGGSWFGNRADGIQ